MSVFDFHFRIASALAVRAPRTQIAVACSAIALFSASASAAPAIRTSAANRVPACASPERLMAFLQSRNPNVDPRYRDIARWYKHWGEAWHVRWDYAFFQMVIETNALKYRRPDGQPGDVDPAQNNFAGIGATGGGVPGDRFPDIKTGVHAQIQHLVAYSGERLVAPIAPRTVEQQDYIVSKSLRLQRPVTFGDLARRWAADRAYSRTIDAVAAQFGSMYCTTVASTAPERSAPAPQPAVRRPLATFAPPSFLGGPKPSGLAGPETLPWADPDVMAREYGNDTDTPIVRQDDGSPKKPPPVRTLWSRDPKTERKRPVAGAPAPKAEPRVSEQATGQLQPSTSVPPPAEPADEPSLPHFKIAPDALQAQSQLPQPSRLGGPLPIETDTTIVQKAAPLPGAHFKEIIGAPAPSANVAVPSDCSILAASYGGKKTLLVRAKIDGGTQYTALTVLDGFEKSMFDIYSKSSAANAEVIGEYASKDEALADARANCSAK